ncbi:NAD(P)H dehydrogenase [Vandammella animalimorsus]|uniref:FMN dependent NADH:quinone oxidoreductase n=1 Tax=Vandammella animalimorsus TaxID=2029117 RepID=A0A2A2T7J4_9BURK|nr:NAD(P)H-dependent oxidoreductase [Vandammella animalimorsus]PAX17811.1 NAD(P)H dehydrogenase [Vandammella animalimorsus]PAX19965.1 NAD(P)H dehydrogenase [Vandammella animalimorsus]
MTTLLHLDASARPGLSGQDAYGSHTRRLSARFVAQWRQHQPDARVIYRDVGQHPPAPVSGQWIHAAFTPEAQREDWMHEALRESDALIDELLAADVIVAGVPMYNFGPPAQCKAWVDNIVRVGRTFGFDRSRAGDPYWPLLAGLGKRAVVLTSRGDYGYDGGKMQGKNHVEASLFTALAYLGITEHHSIAVEYDEYADERLTQSLRDAEAAVDALAARLTAAMA